MTYENKNIWEGSTCAITTVESKTQVLPDEG